MAYSHINGNHIPEKCHFQLDKTTAFAPSFGKEERGDISEKQNHK